MPTSPSPPSPFCQPAQFFMKFHGPQALYNRRQKTIVCLTTIFAAREETKL
jgi:hypothetical protein